MKRFLIAALWIAASPGTVLAQDLEAGEASFRKCAPCHSVGEDATNKVGPVLNGLDGRKAGAVEGFSYSDANKNSGLTWNEETFKEYIKDPRAKVEAIADFLTAKVVKQGPMDQAKCIEFWGSEVEACDEFPK
jgi:cytochrome c